MAGSTGEPIGPFPPGVDPVEYDKLRRRVLWTMPSGLYLIGSRAGERRNVMTANWITQLSFEPKLIGVSVEHGALTHALISEGQVFSVSIVDREDRAVVRKFVKPVEAVEAAEAGHGSGGQACILNGFGFHDGPTGAPIFDQAVAWLDCEVRQRVEVGGHTMFVGEIAGCGFQKPEDTAVLRMEDTRMNYGG